MQQDFEATLNEFLAKAKIHYEAQNGVIEECERLMNQAAERFLDQQAFVNAVVDSLQVIALEQTSKKSTHTKHERVESEHSAVQTLPAVTEVSKDRVLAMSPKLESIDPKKVLIVDQTELNRVLMGRFFKSLPVTLEFASNGEQALGKIGSSQFDLVLMNLQLNGISGSEAIRTIRNSQTDARKKTRIIAIASEKTSDEEMREVVESGADECIGKETPRDVIREKVIDCLISASGPDA
jgi:CheY-like chemotaxis protein